MLHYVQNVGGALTDERKYYTGNTGKYFASPMKELNEKTVLTEDALENRNDSYRQHTKYNDSMDCYYSTYDLGILLQNKESYLQGTINSSQDVDGYFFPYQQKNFYEKMGISSEVSILLECQNGDCNLILYDSYGNQVGMAKDDGSGNKKLVLPDLAGVTSQYFIRVEGANTAVAFEEKAYRIRITETKSRDIQSDSVQKYETSYQNQLDRIHEMQFEALPESDKYLGNATVEELLERMKRGEQLDNKEMAYVKIFANLADYEKAEAMNYIQNKLYPDIQKKAEQKGIELPDGLWKIEMDAAGNISVAGDMTEENRRELEEMLSDNFAGDLWERYVQTMDISHEQYRLLHGYHEVERFIRKATGGQYSFQDITIKEDGKIGGLPDKMCQQINSQEANAKNEELRDDIYMLMDYRNKFGMEDILNFNVKYQVSDSGLRLI